MARKKSGMKRLMEWWPTHVGEVISSEQLREIAGIQEHARRIRELRQSYGWEIDSYRSHDDLKPNEYRLAKPPPEGGIKLSSGISAKLRSQVIARDGSICQLCGRAAGELYEDGSRVTLHVDHILPRSAGGSDDMSNLRTLCHRCNEGAKGNLTPPPQTLRQLKALVRNADRETQKAIYDFLVHRFEGSK